MTKHNVVLFTVLEKTDNKGNQEVEIGGHDKHFVFLIPIIFYLFIYDHENKKQEN